MSGRVIVTGVLLVLALGFISSCKDDGVNKSIATVGFDGYTITYNSKEYPVYVKFSIERESLDRIIGNYYGLVVYSIKGEDENDWIAMDDSECSGPLVYKETSVPDVSFGNFNPKSVTIVTTYAPTMIGEITDGAILSRLAQIIDTGSSIPYTNLGTIEDSKTLQARSDAYPSLIYLLSYEKYDSAGKIIVDRLQERAYQIGDLLSPYVK